MYLFLICSIANGVATSTSSTPFASDTGMQV